MRMVLSHGWLILSTVTGISLVSTRHNPHSPRASTTTTVPQQWKNKGTSIVERVRCSFISSPCATISRPPNHFEFIRADKRRGHACAISLRHFSTEHSYVQFFLFATPAGHHHENTPQHKIDWVRHHAVLSFQNFAQNNVDFCTIACRSKNARAREWAHRAHYKWCMVARSVRIPRLTDIQAKVQASEEVSSPLFHTARRPKAKNKNGQWFTVARCQQSSGALLFGNRPGFNEKGVWVLNVSKENSTKSYLLSLYNIICTHPYITFNMGHYTDIIHTSIDRCAHAASWLHARAPDSRAFLLIITTSWRHMERKRRVSAVHAHVLLHGCLYIYERY